VSADPSGPSISTGFPKWKSLRKVYNRDSTTNRGRTGKILNFKVIIVALVVCAVVSLGVFGATASAGGDGGQVTDVDMMKKLANSPGAFVFVDLQAMRADADLEDVYDVLERDVEIWIEPLDMDFDEVDSMGLGGRVAAFEGLFSLEQLRCKLKANGFVKTEYRGVETWEKDAEGEIITCPNGGLFSWLSCTGCENPSTKPCNPCFESCSDEAEPEPKEDGHDCGYVDSVALMSSRGFLSRGHETVLTGRRDWVRDSIGVIKYGDASIHDDSDFGDITGVLPRGTLVKYQKERLLDLYEYEGLLVSGISVEKKDEDTLGIRGACQFVDSDAASAAKANIQSDLENDPFARWDNVEARSDGRFVKVTFETSMARRAIVDVAPPCITMVAVGGMTMTGAVITWLTDEPATGMIEYGETDALELTPVGDLGLTTTHTLRLSGLTPDTVYRFRVTSVDASGNDAASASFEFRTLGHLPPDSYTVIDDNGQAALRIQLSRIQLATATALDLSLTNPDNVRVGTDSVNPGDTEAVLHMAQPHLAPLPGIYTLAVVDASGKEIVWSEFAFLENQISVSEVALDWQYVSYAGRYTLYGIEFTLQNDGDLPVYLERVEVTIGSLTFEMGIDELVLPEEHENVTRSTYFTGLAPAAKKLTLRFLDQAGVVCFTYSATVTPS
jgi:hypothetical protein